MYTQTHTHVRHAYQVDELTFLRFAEDLFQKRVEDAVTGAAIDYVNNKRDWTNVIGVCNRWRKLVETALDKEFRE